ncbi:hypothetical protein SAMN05444004_101478 [Jannaschia faecimaris]|uniref:Uncharacterized protein n=1 Tax=Jannaschia faecimaris TaxID=1244108 RepID=A0A1H3JZJ0_9RHOB|nr:DUF5665 domain-containing protein [Jannaschia faecimaris]SDY45342.1 hypothetical protein SAMN05444004_101478 [Jannaschia faecimaris]
MNDDVIHEEIAGLRRELAHLNSHRFIRVHNSFPKLIMFQLVRGLAFGLGSVLGATLVLSVVVWSLSQIDFIPVIGDLANEILAVIQPNLGVDIQVDEQPIQEP